MSDVVYVTKEFTFDSAHQLVGHSGKCRNLHGHTYRLQVTVGGKRITTKGTDEGFIIDFADLKNMVKNSIVDPLDHAFIATGNEPVLEVVKREGYKVFNLNGLRSTCENLATFIFNALTTEIAGYAKHYGDERSELFVHSVALWETPTSYAEVVR